MTESSSSAPALGPTLSVAVGTRNRLSQIRLCLDSLVGKIGVDHEIVVVDLGSTDGTLEYLRSLGGIRLVQDEPVGQSVNLNRVFRATTAKYCCWLSDDNVVLDGMLDLAASILEQNPDIGMVGLKVKDVVGRSQIKEYIGAVSPTGVLNCNQGVIRAQLFRQIGFFDERFQTYGIDPDLTMKVLLAGHKVVHTRRVAIHHYRDHSASPGAIQIERREKEKRSAYDLYCQKYHDWIAERPKWQSALYRAARLYVISIAYRLARRCRLPLEAWVGYNERDWSNMLYTRYISRLDFLKNRRHPYYLVQSMRAASRK